MIPLTKLTKKDQVFKWGREQEEGFKSIKALFTDENNLQSHNPEGRLMVEILKEENIL